MLFSGKVIDLKPDGEFVVIGHTDDIPGFIKKGFESATIDLQDSRRITDAQRKLAKALTREIAEYTGYTPAQAQETLKHDFVLSREDTLIKGSFSLSNTDMTTAGEYIDYLILWMVENGVHSRYPLYRAVDNIDRYVWACFMHRSCCVCGKSADLHHVDRIGMGADRDEVAQVGMHVMTLCREHHQLIHSMGERRFFKQYHLHGIPLTQQMVIATRDVYHFTAANAEKLPEWR